MRDKNAFDLFEGLASLSSGNKEWYNNLSEAGQKASAPFVMTRWMTGTSDAAQIIRLNTVVNPYLFAGTADKSALFKLMAVAATGKSKRYSWVKGPGAKTKKMTIDVIKAYYDCSTREAVTYKVSNEDLLEMAEELGLEKEDVAKLKKELDDTGTTQKPSGKPAKPLRGKRA